MSRKPKGHRDPKSVRHTRVHAARRAYERYGVALTPRDVEEISGRIRNHNATPVYKQSNTRTLYQVEWNGHDFYVAYQKGLGVLTFLTPEMVARHEQADISIGPS